MLIRNLKIIAQALATLMTILVFIAAVSAITGLAIQQVIATTLPVLVPLDTVWLTPLAAIVEGMVIGLAGGWLLVKGIPSIFNSMLPSDDQGPDYRAIFG